MSHLHKFYRLSGESLKAAEKLHEIAAAFFSAHKREINGRNLADLQREARDMHQKLFEKVENEAPELLRQLGFYNPAIRVKTGSPDALPRSYETFPSIHIGQSKDGPVYLMASSYDYKGDHFRPLHGRTVNEAQELRFSDFGDMFYNGTPMSESPLLYKPDQGTATPDDFDATKHSALNTYFNAENGLTEKVFIASQRSLHIVSSFRERQKEYEDASSALMDEVKKITEALYDSEYVVGRQGEENLYTNLMMRPPESYGKPVIELSISSHERGGDPLVIRDNPYFTISGQKGGNIEIAPNDDTEEGRTLRKKFESVPSQPNLSSYWQLHNPTAPEVKDIFNQNAAPSKDVYRAPRLEDVGGIYYLIYQVSTDLSKDDHCFPPDAIPVNPAEYHWAKADREDRRMGIKPPPLPDALSYMEPRRKAIAAKTHPQDNGADAGANGSDNAGFVKRWLRKLIP